MDFGYARVSTTEQNLDLQIDALKKYGCSQIFSEKLNGSTRVRPELEKLLTQLRKEDVLVVYKLDRLGRSLINIINLVLELSQKGIIIKSITEGIDTSVSTGRLLLNVMASFAEYEKELIRERTNAGLSSARARGRVGGRPKGFTSEVISKLKLLRSVYKDRTKTPKEIYTAFSISHASFYRFAKILDTHTDAELDNFLIKRK
jgi:DNA invertase Pin-like site-specific DNA recombinase